MLRIRKYWPSLLLSLLLTYSVIALQATAYALSCGWQVSEVKERAYDKMLKLDAKERAATGSLHLPSFIPWHRLSRDDFFSHPSHIIMSRWTSPLIQ